MGRVAFRAVCGDYGDRVARRGQGVAGVFGDLGVDLDAGHIFRPESVGEQGSVVAGASADLEDAVTGLGMQGGEHLRDHVGLTGRAGDVAAGLPRSAGMPVIDLGHHRTSAVGTLQPRLRVLGPVQRHEPVTVVAPDCLGDEQMTRHGRERLPPARGQITAVGKLGKHPGGQTSGAAATWCPHSAG